MTFEVHGIDELVRDLSDAPRKVQRQVPDVVRKGAVQIKDEARRLAEGNRYAPYYPASISFDDGWKGRGYEAEIGPDKDRPQGALGNILEYGVPSQGTSPQPHLRPALDNEEPRFLRALEDLGDL